MGFGNPVLAFGRMHRRVDDPEDVARARQHEALRASDMIVDLVGLRPRRDVVILGGDGIQGLGDARQVEPLASDLERVGLDQPILEVELAQIPRMHRVRHARRVHVPVQHVEGRRLFTIQPAMHDVVPDERVRAQQAEGGGHLSPVEVARAGHVLLERAHAGLVDEDLDVAGLVKVHQRGEQREIGDRHLLGDKASVRPGHVHGQRGAPDAVADRVHPARTGKAAGRLDDGMNPIFQIVVEARVAHVGTGILPARYEDVEALVQEIAHHALARYQVEHVELVNPGRHDDDGFGMDGGLRRRVVDDLEQLVAKDDRPGGRCQVLADLEIVGAGHPHLARLQVAEHQLHAAHQALPVRGEGLANRHRIGPEEVRRRDRIEPLAPPERRATPLLA